MPIKILIVDDSKLARMAVTKALNALQPDWIRLEAADADSALTVVKTQSPHIALLDFNMPGRDGLLLAADIREVDPTVRTAVISANHQVEVVERARAAGAAFLRKPITEQTLQQFFDSLDLADAQQGTR